MKNWAIVFGLVLLLGLMGAVENAPAAKVKWKTAGASVFTDQTGQKDINLYRSPLAFAELNMGTAMGSLPFGTKIRIWYGRTGAKVSAYRLDIGAGGGDVFGRWKRAIDIHCRTLIRLRVHDCTSWTGVVRWRVIRWGLG